MLPDHDLIARFLAYLDASPTPHHAVAHTASLLSQAGFTHFPLGATLGDLPPGTPGFFTKAGTLIAFRLGSSETTRAGFRIAAAHTDSPNLRVKPKPIMRQHGYVRLGIETYGGVLQASWLDRDLHLAGLVTLRDGTGIKQVLIRLDDLRLRIPNLAIHLNRTVNSDGLKVNAQTGLPPLLALDVPGADPVADPLSALLAEQLGCDQADLLAWDLSLVDASPAALGGMNNELVYSGRLDNLGSCHAGVEGLIAASKHDAPDCTAVLALFDHEEVGSTTARGADSRTLEDALAALHAASGSTAPLTAALANTMLISADMAHAVHPAHADLHDPQHMPLLNQGPVIKQNASQRYGTEGETAALFTLLCEAAGVKPQWFVNRADLACGSTVGPILAGQLGVRTVDVGNPMLSMHSAREMCGAFDQQQMAKVMTQHFLGAARLN